MKKYYLIAFTVMNTCSGLLLHGMHSQQFRNDPYSLHSSTNQAVIYDKRVIAQHSKDDMYHGFAWGIDPYILKYGEISTKMSTRGKPETLYSIPGQIEWHENGNTTQHFVVFQLVKDRDGIIYHRGMIYNPNNKVLSDFKYRYNKHMEWVNHNILTQEQQTFSAKSIEEATVLQDNEFVTTFFDKNLNRKISLFKINSGQASLRQASVEQAGMGQTSINSNPKYSSESLLDWLKRKITEFFRGTPENTNYYFAK